MNSPVSRLCSVARGRDSVVSQLLFAAMPLDFSGLNLPDFLDLGSISRLAQCPAHPCQERHRLRVLSRSVLTADRAVNLVRQREMPTAAFGCDESGGGEVGRDSRLSGACSPLFGSELRAVPRLHRGPQRGAAACACLHRGLSSACKRAGFDKRGEGEG